MSLLENFSLALTSIRANKMRSLLTMLGIIIGIAAVIAIQTIGAGNRTFMMRQFSAMGSLTDINVTVSQRIGPNMDPTAKPEPRDYLTDSMLEELQKAYPDMIDCIKTSVSVGSVDFPKLGQPSATVSANLSGINTSSQRDMQKGDQLLAGRFLMDGVDEDRDSILVSDLFLAQSLGGTPEMAVGKAVTTTINGALREFHVVGVYHDSTYSPDRMAYAMTSHANLYISQKQALRITGQPEGYVSVAVAATDSDYTEALAEQVKDFLNSYYKNSRHWNITTSSNSNILSMVSDNMKSANMSTSAIAAIALLVGGIGIMNIMMVSVTERTREIGIRKALGAPSAAILLQFITESVVLCLVGGIIGIAVGIGIGAVASRSMGYDVTISVPAIIVSFFFSMIVGVFFGYYPANKAAKMDPIEALRYE